MLFSVIRPPRRNAQNFQTGLFLEFPLSAWLFRLLQGEKKKTEIQLFLPQDAGRGSNLGGESNEAKPPRRTLTTDEQIKPEPSRQRGTDANFNHNGERGGKITQTTTRKKRKKKKSSRTSPTISEMERTREREGRSVENREQYGISNAKQAPQCVSPL